MKNKKFIDELMDISPALKNFAKALAKDVTNAGDLYQETMLKVLLNQEKFIPDTSLQSWAYKIMYNSFINNYKSNQRYLLVERFDPHKTIKNPPIRPDEHCQELEIYQAIETLNDHLKIAFKLYLNGYKYKEMASILNIPEGTAKTRIYHAKKNLKKIVF